MGVRLGVVGMRGPLDCPLGPLGSEASRCDIAIGSPRGPQQDETVTSKSR